MDLLPRAVVPSLALQLFGSFQGSVDGEPLPRLRTRKGEQLLALLALRGGEQTQREWIAEILWPDSDRWDALDNLRRSLTDLRRALGGAADRLRSPTPRSLSLDLGDADCDVFQFKAAIARGDAQSLLAAVGLYQGALLERCTEAWVVPERVACREAYLLTLEGLADLAMATGECGQAIGYLRRLMAEDPLRESTACRLMEALAAHGDHAAVAQTYRDYRVELHREMNLAPAPATVALFRHLTSHDTVSRMVGRRHSWQQAACSVQHLPRPRTSLIGREHDQALVAALLRRTARVTLTGEGGVGKTRLAIAAARAAAHQFPDGLCFVDLASVVGGDGVADTVANSLGLEFAGTAAIQAVLKSIQRKSLLLIIDNCEHVIDACVRLTDAVLTACPNVAVLATSREPLRIPGEIVWRVPALSVPSVSRSATERDARALLEFDAVRLFVERAACADRTFRLVAANQEAVARICVRLDGLPLALEMAAAEVPTLGAGELEARLEDPFELLKRGSRTALPRQQTLRATVDWSYDRLTEAERTLLRRLSVFSGDFSLGASHAVCADEGVGTASWLGCFTGLVEKSLIAINDAEDHGGGRRYCLSEIVRHYAAEQLALTDEAEWVQGRHRAYFSPPAAAATPKHSY